MNTNVSAMNSTGAKADALNTVEVRFPATYAWMAIGFGAIFFLLGLLIALVNHHRNLGVGVLLVVLSLAAVVGANYWRKHLHVVAQLTPQQLILRRDGAVNWEEIAAIEKNEIHASYHGARGKSDFVCIKLKTKRAPKGGLQGFLLKAKEAMTGYDIIVPMSEFACGTDWFVAECQKRMATAASRQSE
jgi:hypothetical protein